MAFPPPKCRATVKLLPDLPGLHKEDRRAVSRQQTANLHKEGSSMADCLSANPPYRRGGTWLSAV
ncbi:hypothetical protein Metal_3820 [Methylomicrobium album BG8]|uniref:Uncharacterized protein n=1 Tax=Methylomicrobium album BG8 TaxID=686340 RepID=H8GIF0_METAL|nr:hypothetical protein Metal_3820 [Methylomicrobium album BG8]